MEKQRRQLQIELGEKESEGVYSNLALMTHSPAEFIIDFARIVPGAQKAKVYSRIIMTPQHAKSLLEVLEKNVKAFEEKHGPIRKAGPEDQPKGDIGF
jgi:hypothetical protein